MKFASPLNRYFTQITLTNRIYLINSAEYLTASKTVTCKQHCRLEPRNLSVFFFTIKIISVKFKIKADTVFTLLYRWLEEERNLELHPWHHKLLKEGFSLKCGICLVPWYLLGKYHSIRNSQGQIPLQWGISGKN